MSDTSYSSGDVSVYSGDQTANADTSGATSDAATGSRGASETQSYGFSDSGFGADTPTNSGSGLDFSPGEVSVGGGYFNQYGFNSPLGPSSGFDSFQSQMPETQWAAIAADTYGIPQNIFNALITKESTWQHTLKNGGILTSPKGALGYTQVLPSTGAALGFDVKDPVMNFFAGASYLSLMKQGITVDNNGNFVRVNNPTDWQTALSRYNAVPQMNSDKFGYGAAVLNIAATNNGYPAGATIINPPVTDTTPAIDKAFPTTKAVVHTGFRIPFTGVRIGGPGIISVDAPSGGSTPVVSAPDLPSKASVEAGVIKAALTQPSPVAVSGSGAATGASGDTSGFDTTGLFTLVSAGSAKANQPKTSAGNLIDPTGQYIIPPIPSIGFPGVKKSTGNFATDLANDAGLSIDWQAYLPLAFVGLLAILFLTVGVKSLLSE